MKTIIKYSFIIFSILANFNLAMAQVENPDTAQVPFHKETDLNSELNKFGLKTLEFPTGDYCERKGSPMTRRDNILTPKFPSDSLVIDRILGDTTYKDWAKTPGDINIFWIHGLNGSTESLRVPAQATQFGTTDFPARKATSWRGPTSSSSNAIQFYSEDGGITPAVGDMENNATVLVPASSRTNRDFIIAHSQGGIVGREWLRKMDQAPNMYQNFAHGLVTIGTPHGGAQVLNQTRPELENKIPSFMEEACKALGKKAVVPLANSNFATQLLISNDMVTKLVNKSCGVIANSIIPLALDNYFKRTTRDFYVGSPFLEGSNNAGAHTQGLNEYTLNVPVVQFYGEEEQPILWKFLSSTMSIGHDILNNKQMEFGYDQDDQMEKKVNDMIDEYYAKFVYESHQENHFHNLEIAYYSAAAIHCLGAFFMPLTTAGVVTVDIYNAVKASAAKNAAIENKHAYDGAKVWLSNANDYYLTDLIGARVTQVAINCRIIEDLECRDAVKNPIGSGVPAVKIKVDRNYNTTAACKPQPISIAYSNYHFKGFDNTEWHGPCTGTQTIISTWKNTYYYKPNDGVVLMESASKDISVNTNNGENTHAFFKLENTNHDQMKNCVKTKKGLLKLYNGELGGFFKIEIR